MRIIAALNDELTKLDRDLGGLIEQSPVWRDKQNLLASVPGIGDKIARALLADLPELGQLDRRAIAALAGLAPFTRESGQWRGKSFIAQRPVRPCLSAPWLPHVITAPSKSSISASSPPENPSVSHSSQQHESSSPS